MQTNLRKFKQDKSIQTLFKPSLLAVLVASAFSGAVHSSPYEVNDGQQFGNAIKGVFFQDAAGNNNKQLQPNDELIVLNDITYSHADTNNSNIINNLTIKGETSAVQIIAGGAGSVLYDKDNTITITKIEDIILTNGRNVGNYGGGLIKVQAINNIENSTFSSSISNRSGGAIDAGNIGNIVIGEFTNNNAGSGGAISATSIGNIESSFFSGNNALSSAGGAVYYGDVNNTNVTVINNSRFITNSAVNRGGAVFVINNALTIKDSYFYQNGLTTASDKLSGSAVYLSKGTLTIDGSSFVGNTDAYAVSTSNNVTEVTIKATAKDTIFKSNTEGAISAHNKLTVDNVHNVVTLDNILVQAVAGGDTKITKNETGTWYLKNLSNLNAGGDVAQTSTFEVNAGAVYLDDGNINLQAITDNTFTVASGAELKGNGTISLTDGTSNNKTNGTITIKGSLTPIKMDVSGGVDHTNTAIAPIFTTPANNTGYGEITLKAEKIVLKDATLNYRISGVDDDKRSLLKVYGDLDINGLDIKYHEFGNIAENDYKSFKLIHVEGKVSGEGTIRFSHHGLKPAEIAIIDKYSLAKFDNNKIIIAVSNGSGGSGGSSGSNRCPNPPKTVAESNNTTIGKNGDWFSDCVTIKEDADPTNNKDAVPGKSLANGHYVVDKDDIVVIGESLTDRTVDKDFVKDNVYGWDGKTLTKSGAGELYLDGGKAHKHEKTIIKEGSLYIGTGTTFKDEKNFIEFQVAGSNTAKVVNEGKINNVIMKQNGSESIFINHKHTKKVDVGAGGVFFNTGKDSETGNVIVTEGGRFSGYGTVQGNLTINREGHLAVGHEISNELYGSVLKVEKNLEIKSDSYWSFGVYDKNRVKELNKIKPGTAYAYDMIDVTGIATIGDDVSLSAGFGNKMIKDLRLNRNRTIETDFTTILKAKTITFNDSDCNISNKSIKSCFLIDNKSNNKFSWGDLIKIDDVKLVKGTGNDKDELQVKVSFKAPRLTWIEDAMPNTNFLEVVALRANKNIMTPIYLEVANKLINDEGVVNYVNQLTGEIYAANDNALFVNSISVQNVISNRIFSQSDFLNYKKVSGTSNIYSLGIGGAKKL